MMKNITLSIITVLLLAFGFQSANAQTIYQRSNRVQMSIDQEFNFMTTGPIPAGYGIAFGPTQMDMFCQDAGAARPIGPFGGLTPTPDRQTGACSWPGSPQDTWAMQYNVGGTVCTFGSNAGGFFGCGTLTPTSPPAARPPTPCVPGAENERKVEWTRTFAGCAGAGNTFSMTQSFALRDDEKFVRCLVKIENTGTTTMTNVEYMRSLDPDQDIQGYGNFVTQNNVLAQPPSPTNLAVVDAVGGTSSLNRYMYSARDPRAKVANRGFGNCDPDATLDGTGCPGGFGGCWATGSPYANADNGMDIAFRHPTLRAGECTYFTFLIIMESTNVAATNIPCPSSIYDPPSAGAGSTGKGVKVQSGELSITTVPPVPAQLCPGETVTIPFEYCGLYDPSNTFIAELSNRTPLNQYDFAAVPPIVGTITIAGPSGAGSCSGRGCITGTITATVPPGVADGLYRIRVAIRSADAPVAESAGCFEVLIVNPRIFDVTGGGTCCNVVGSPCLIPVCLSGSEVGVTYYLYRDGVDLGITRAGTGVPFCFPDQTINGLYEIFAVKDGFPTCRARMNNTVTATIINDTEPGRVTADQIICSSPIGTAAPLNLSGTPTLIGTVLNWESGTLIGGTFAPLGTIANTTTTLNPGVLGSTVTSTICYRAVVRSGPAGVCAVKGSEPACVTIIPLALTPDPIVGRNPVCRDLDLGVIYTTNPARDPGSSYIWTVTPSAPIRFGPFAGPGVASPSGFRAAIDWTVPVGNYTVRVRPYKLAGPDTCFGPTTSLVVTVISQVEAPVYVDAPSPFCPGETGLYRVSLPATSQPATGGYAWSITPVGLGTIVGPGTGSSVNIRWDSPGTATICVNAIGDCGAGPQACTTVVVKQPPTILTVNPTTSDVCPNQRGVRYTASSTGPAPTFIPADNYIWNVPPEAVLVSGQGTPNIIVDWTNRPASRRTYVISVTSYYLGCEGPTRQSIVNVLDPPPLQPSPIAGNNAVCRASTERYSVSPIGATDPVVREYEWSGIPLGPPGVSAILGGADPVTGRGGNAIDIQWTRVPRGRYTLSVVPINECGRGPARTLIIDVEDIPPAPGPITPPPFHCVGASARYTVQPIARPNITYIWSTGGGCLITPPTSGVDLLTVSIIPTSLTPCDIEVYSENRCGRSATPATFTIRPITVPSQPSVIGGKVDVCQNERARYNVTATPDVTYDWIIQPQAPLTSTTGISIESGQGTNVIDINWGTAAPGRYDLVVTPSNICGVGTPRVTVFPIVVTKVPDQPSAIGGPIEVCEATVGRYGVVRDLNADAYRWATLPSAGVTLVQNVDSSVITWTPPGNYIVTVTPSNRCGDGVPRNLAVSVVERPRPNAGPDVITCGPNHVLIGRPTGGVWSCVSCPPPSSIVSAGPYGIVRDMTPRLHGFQYSIDGGVCGLQSDTVFVDNQLPIVGRVISDQTVCSDASGTLTLVGYTSNARIIRWESSTDNFLTVGVPIANTSDSYTFTNLPVTTQFRAVLEMPGGSCQPHSAHATVTIVRKDIANPSPTTLTVCGTDAILNGNIPTQGRGEWSYISGPAGANARIATSVRGQGMATGLTLNGDYVFRYTIINPPCNDPTMSADVVVTKIDGITVADAGANQRVCTETAILIGNVPRAGETATWSFVTGPVLAHVTTAGNIGNVLNMITPGRYVFRYTITSVACVGSSSADVVVDRLTPPTVAVAGSDQEVCNVSTAMLNGNMPLNGTGTWSFVSGPAGATPNVSTSGNIGRAFNMTVEGTYVFRYTISNGACAPSTADVRVTRINPGTVAQVTQSRYRVCNDEFITIDAVAPPVGSGTWSYISGPAIANVITTGTTGQVDGMVAAGRYVFRWTVSNRCGSSSTDVEVVREVGITPPVTVKVTNLWVCDMPTALGEGSPVPAGATGVWRFISGPFPAQIRTFERYGAVTSMDVPGPYVFAWEVSSGTCPPSVAYMTVTRTARPTVASGGSDLFICGNVATLTGNVPTPGIGTWSFVSGPRTASVSQRGTVATVSAMVDPGDYIFRYAITSDPMNVCPTTSDDVTVRVSPGTVPGILGGNATVCSGRNRGTIALSGFTGNIVRWETSTDGFASVVNPVGNRTATLNYTNLTSSMSYRVVVKQGDCPEQVSNVVTVTVLDASVRANAGLDQTICVNNTILRGNMGSTGTGTWTLLSAPAGAAPAISTTGVEGFVTRLDVSGDYMFQWTLDYGTCGRSSDNVLVRVNAGVNAGTLAGGTTVCAGTNSGTLTLSGFSGRIVRWERSVDNFVNKFDIINASPTLRYTNLTTSTTYRVVLSSPLCGTLVSNEVTVVVRGSAAVADAGFDRTVCGNSVSLTGNDPGSAMGTWTATSIPAGAAPNLSSSGRSLTVTDMSVQGNYVFRWTIDNGTCGRTFDDVTVRVSDRSVAGSVLGTTTLCQGPNSGTLRLTGFVGEVVRWEMSTDNWITPMTISNVGATQTYTNLTQTTQYRAVVRSGSCPEQTSIDAAVTIVRPGVAANAGPSSTICSGDIAILLGNRPTSGTGTWSFLSGPSGSSPTIMMSGGTGYVSGLLPGMSTLRYTIDNRPCETTFSDVQVTVLPGAVAGSITGATSVCGRSATGLLTLVGHSGSIMRWETSTDNFVSTNLPIANTGTTQPFTGLTRTTWYRAIVSSATCGGTRATLPVRVEVAMPPTPAVAGPNQEVCTPTTLLSGNIPTVGTGMWSVVSNPAGAAASVVTSSNIGSVTGMTLPGDYVFRYTVSSGSCPLSTADLVVRVTRATVSGIVTTATPVLCSAINTGSVNLLGNVGDVVRWETSTNGTTFTPTAVTTNVFSFANLAQTTWFRAVVRNGGCTEATTVPVRVVVNDAVSAGALMGDASVCAGSNTGSVTLSGFTGTVVRWESSIDGFGSILPVANTSTILNYSGLSATTQYRAVLRSGSCPEQASNAVTITVLPNVAAGTLSMPMTVCGLSNSGVLNIAASSGGVVRWERSTSPDFTTGVTLISNTSTSLGFTDLTMTSYFRALVGNAACGTQYTNIVPVTVDVSSSGGVITGGSLACAGSNSGTLTLGGHTGSILRWEHSTDGFATVSTVLNTTPTESYLNLSAARCYRAVTRGGVCPEVFSAVKCVDISPVSVGGTPNISVTNVCSGSDQEISLVGSVGDVVRWESSTDCAGFSSPQTISSTSTMLRLTGITQSRCYRAIVKSGACAEATSLLSRIDVTPGSVAGTITGATPVCAGTASGTLTVSGNIGGIVRWETSRDGFITVSGSTTTTSSTFNYSGITETTSYRVVVQNGVCPPVNSAPVTVAVSPVSVGGSVSSSVVSVCGGGSATVTLAGQVGDVVRWEVSTDCAFASRTSIANTTSTLSLTGLAQTGCYRAVVKSGACTEVNSSNVLVTVNSSPAITAGSVVGCNNQGSITARATGGVGVLTFGIIPPVEVNNTTGQFSPIPSGSYVVSVVDANGCGTTTPVTIGTTPTPTEIILVSGLSTTQATVEWTAVPPFTGVTYNLRYRVQGSTPWTQISGITMNMRNLTGLQNNTTYEIEVQYICPNGQASAFSSTGIRTLRTLPMSGATCVGANPPGVPAPIPGGVFVSDVLATSAIVNWNAVASAPGYIVSYGPATVPTSSWTQENVCSPNTRLVLTGLTPGIAYRVRVRTNCSNCTTALDVSNIRSDFSLQVGFSTLTIRGGEEALAGLTNLTVYPNPNKGQFTVSFDSENETPVDLTIRDLTGKSIWTGQLAVGSGANNREVSMDSNVASGVYLLEVRQGTAVRTIKVMVN
jgi:hypothetical protein